MLEQPQSEVTHMAMRRDELEKGPTAIGAGAAGRPGELNALLGKGSAFEGKFTGEIVSTDTLMIGEGAEVKGQIQVGSLIIVGDYNGDAKATKSIEIKAPAKVRGTLTTASIVIERGVFYEGNCKMDTSGAPPASSGPPRRPTPTPDSAH